MKKKLGALLIAVLLIGGFVATNIESLAYMAMSMQYEKAKFEVSGDKAIMTGVIDGKTVIAVNNLIKNHPEVKTIVMQDVPGSMDDESNLIASRLVREAGLNTHVPHDGMIASGGTDFFCAGVKRTVEEGAQIGVHSWAGDGVTNADLLPKDHKEHAKYIDYYKEMQIPQDFYWFTIQAADADGMHFMTTEELVKYDLIQSVTSKPVDSIKIMSNKDQSIDGFKPFEKYTEVFGIKLYAMKDVADDKLLHASKIMAEYLDNDNDGSVDNELVHSKLIEKKATMVLFKNNAGAEAFFEKSGRDLDELDELGYNLQDLYDSEIHLKGSKSGKFDASLEEVLHLITHVGYANVYPDVFGEKPGSEIADAMDTARGGYFKKVPSKYPESAWFSYYDETADYGTMVTEYTYWAMTSILGAQADPERMDFIQDEWKLNTEALVREKDSEVYNILTNPEYKMPSQLPDGVYEVMVAE